MFIDLHAHTGGISRCCKADAETILRTAADSGFDGVAITNHYTGSYFTDEDYGEWIEKYIAEWQLCRRLGSEMGLRIFCGVEVTIDAEPRLHMLMYGADEAFLRSQPKLCRYSVAELSALCRQNGFALVQAHPFRGGATMQDPACLDGVEINCHPLYLESHSHRLLEAAAQYGLAVTAGCDYHADVAYRPLGGVYLPDDIADEQALAEFILRSRTFSLQIQEPSDQTLWRTEYRRL